MMMHSGQYECDGLYVLRLLVSVHSPLPSQFHPNHDDSASGCEASVNPCNVKKGDTGAHCALENMNQIDITNFFACVDWRLATGKQNRIDIR